MGLETLVAALAANRTGFYPSLSELLASLLVSDVRYTLTTSDVVRRAYSFPHCYVGTVVDVRDTGSLKATPAEYTLRGML